MKMDRKYWLHRVIVCFLMMIIIIQIPMHAYADEKRMVAIGTNAEYAPFEYLDSNGNLTGFDIELMNAIAKEAGFEVKWVCWDLELISQLVKKKCVLGPSNVA